MSTDFQIGDRVTYTRKFLKACAIYTDVPRGAVVGLEPATDSGRLVYVKWDGDPTERPILDCNLIRVTDLHKEQH